MFYNTDPLFASRSWFPSSRCLSHACLRGPDSLLKGLFVLEALIMSCFSPQDAYPRGPDSLYEALIPSGSCFLPPRCPWLQSPLFHLSGTSPLVLRRPHLEVQILSSRRALRSWLPHQNQLCLWGSSPSLGPPLFWRSDYLHEKPLEVVLSSSRCPLALSRGQFFILEADIVLAYCISFLPMNFLDPLELVLPSRTYETLPLKFLVPDLWPLEMWLWSRDCLILP